MLFLLYWITEYPVSMGFVWISGWMILFVVGLAFTVFALCFTIKNWKRLSNAQRAQWCFLILAL